MVRTRGQRQRQERDLAEAIRRSSTPEYARNIQHLVRRKPRNTSTDDLLNNLLYNDSSQESSQDSNDYSFLMNMETPRSSQDWPQYRESDDTHRHRLGDDQAHTEQVRTYTRRVGASGRRRVPYSWRNR